MLPKQFIFPKKGFGSSNNYSPPTLTLPPTKDDFKTFPKSPRSGSTRNLSPLLRGKSSPEPSPSNNSTEHRIRELARNVTEAKDLLERNRIMMLNELPIFQESLKKEIQALMSKFINEWKARQKESKQDSETLKADMNEKNISNLDQSQANKTLAYKNKTLSTILSVPTNPELEPKNKKENSLSPKFGSGNSGFRRSPERSLTMGSYTESWRRKRFGIERKVPQTPCSYRDKRSARTNIFVEKSLSVASASPKKITSSDTRGGKDVKSKKTYSNMKKKGQTVDSEGIDPNYLLNVVQTLGEDLKDCQKVALEENKKYVEAVRLLDAASNERKALLETINENEELIQQSQSSIQRLNLLFSGVQPEQEGAGEMKDQTFGDQDGLQGEDGDLGEDAGDAREVLEKKIELISQEKEEMAKEFENTKAELEAIMLKYKEVIERSTKERRLEDSIHDGESQNGVTTPRDELVGLKEELREVKKAFEEYKARAEQHLEEKEKDDNEKKALKEELEKVSKELDEYKAKHVHDLKIHDENYSAHLEIITELTTKIEMLTDECEQLRNFTDKECDQSKSIVRERDSCENVEDLFVKFGGLERSLHYYLEERKHLTSENDQLKAELNGIKQKTEVLNGESRVEEMEAQVAGPMASQLEQQIMSLQSERNELLVQTNGYKDQVSGLEARIEEIESRKREIEAQKEEIEGKLAVLMGEKEELVEKNKEYESNIDELIEKIEELQTEIEKYKEESNGKKPGDVSKEGTEEVEALKKKLEDNEHDITELRKENEMLEKLARMNKDRSEELESLMGNMKLECDFKVQEYEKMMQHYGDNMTFNRNSEEEIIERYQQLQEVCEEWELKCERLAREKQELERELEVCQEELEELKRR